MLAIEADDLSHLPVYRYRHRYRYYLLTYLLTKDPHGQTERTSRPESMFVSLLRGYGGGGGGILLLVLVHVNMR